MDSIARTKKSQKVTIVGAVVDFLLSVFKVIVGVIGNSGARGIAEGDKRRQACSKEVRRIGKKDSSSWLEKMLSFLLASLF